MNTQFLGRWWAQLFRGTVPVDGGAPVARAAGGSGADGSGATQARGRDAALRRAEAEPHEPLRWGNFR